MQTCSVLAPDSAPTAASSEPCSIPDAADAEETARSTEGAMGSLGAAFSCLSVCVLTETPAVHEERLRRTAPTTVRRD